MCNRIKTRIFRTLDRFGLRIIDLMIEIEIRSKFENMIELENEIKFEPRFNLKVDRTTDLQSSIKCFNSTLRWTESLIKDCDLFSTYQKTKNRIELVAQ